MYSHCEWQHFWQAKKSFEKVKPPTWFARVPSQGSTSLLSFHHTVHLASLPAHKLTPGRRHLVWGDMRRLSNIAARFQMSPALQRPSQEQELSNKAPGSQVLFSWPAFQLLSFFLAVLGGVCSLGQGDFRKFFRLQLCSLVQNHLARQRSPSKSINQCKWEGLFLLWMTSAGLQLRSLQTCESQVTFHEYQMHAFGQLCSRQHLKDTAFTRELQVAKLLAFKEMSGTEKESGIKVRNILLPPNEEIFPLFSPRRVVSSFCGYLSRSQGVWQI